MYSACTALAVIIFGKYVI